MNTIYESIKPKVCNSLWEIKFNKRAIIGITNDNTHNVQRIK